MMLKKGIFALLLMHSLNLYASRAYITDVFGGQVFVDTNGVIETVSVAGGTAPFVNPSYVSVSHDGKLAIVNDYGGGSATIYSIDIGTNIATGVTNNTATPYSGTFSSAFSPTQPKAYVGGVGVIYVVDTTTNTAIRTVAVAGGLPAIGSILSLAFSNDGTFAYATSFSDGVFVIDTSNDTASAMISTALGVPNFLSAVSVAMNPTNSAHAYVGDNAVGAVFIIDNITKQAIGTVSTAGGIPSFASPYDIAFSRDGELSYVTDNGIQGVLVIDTGLNAITQIEAASFGVPPFTTPLGVAFSPDGTFAFVTDVNTDGLFYIDTTTGNATAFIHLPGAGGTQGIAFVPAPLPPTNLRVKKKKNDFGLTYTLHHVLSWKTSSSKIASYNIYHEGNPLSSTTGQNHIHRNVLKGSAHYGVTAIDIFGVESDPATVSTK